MTIGNRMRPAFAGLVLSCATAIAGCGSTTKGLDLPPPPSAPPPAVLKVPTWVPLPVPPPCEEPAYRDVQDEIDGLNAGDAWRVWGMCNANRLNSLREKAGQPATIPAPASTVPGV